MEKVIQNNPSRWRISPRTSEVSNLPLFRLSKVFAFAVFRISYPETKLLWGLQKHGVPLVPPPKLFPQAPQLDEELLDLGAARVPCTDQLVALLGKQHETDERKCWRGTIYVVKYWHNAMLLGDWIHRFIRLMSKADFEKKKKTQKTSIQYFFKGNGIWCVSWLTLFTTSILSLLFKISCSRAYWHLLATSSPSQLAIEHTCVAVDTLSFSQDKVWKGQKWKTDNSEQKSGLALISFFQCCWGRVTLSADTVNFWSCTWSCVWLSETVASLGFLQQRKHGHVTPVMAYIKTSHYVSGMQPGAKCHLSAFCRCLAMTSSAQAALSPAGEEVWCADCRCWLWLPGNCRLSPHSTVLCRPNSPTMKKQHNPWVMFCFDCLSSAE